MNYQQLINKSIKSLRIRKNLTQEQFAEYIGMSTAGLKKLEQNKYQPSSDTIDKICTAFNISPLDLLIDDSNKNKSETIKVINLKLEQLNESELSKVLKFIDLIKD